MIVFKSLYNLLNSHLRFFFFFDSTDIGTQGFALRRQVLYHLSHTSNPFHSVYFGDRVSLFAQASLD
jgi:hypothetical protein